MIVKNKLGKQYSKYKKIMRSCREDYEIITRKNQIADLQKLKGPFFMIGIPGSLHIMALSTKLIPSEVDLVLILNGMDEWEQNWATQNINTKAIIKLSTKLIIPHSKVLDMLFDNLTNLFGILDYDCFVFNPTIFQQMQSLSNTTLLNLKHI